MLTHAHLDHSGFLPRLAKLGFRGAIHCTQATADLCAILLPDAGHLQEEEAQFANRKGFSKHHPALPLFTEAEARAVLSQLEPHGFGAEFDAAGFAATLHPAGHILGAAMAHVAARGASDVLFSGDLGRARDPLMLPPADPPAARHVVVESTYGDRLHPKEDAFEAIATAVGRAAARGGVVVVPAFAVGRAQALLHILARLKAQRRIPELPLFLNSPMAVDATQIFLRHRGEHRLSQDECEAMCAGVRVVNTVEESKSLNARSGPMIIVSASGMATGGRVLHHLKAFAPDPRNMILLTGFQAAGTRGAAIEAGAAEVKIHGEYVPIRAEVASMELLSAHADYPEILAWLAKLRPAPREVFVTHGEPAAADALRVRVGDALKVACRVPRQGEAVTLAQR